MHLHCWLCSWVGFNVQANNKTKSLKLEGMYCPFESQIYGVKVNLVGKS